MKSRIILGGVFIFFGSLKSAEKGSEPFQGKSFFESPESKEEQNKIRLQIAQLDREIAELKNRANPDRQKIEKKRDERCELYMTIQLLSGSRFE